jgi:hypothetical protein
MACCPARQHGLTAQEIRDAIVCVRGLPFTWDRDPDRGWRVLVETQVRDRNYVVVLYPVDDPLSGVFSLGTAYPRGDI